MKSRWSACVPFQKKISSELAIKKLMVAFHCASQLPAQCEFAKNTYNVHLLYFLPIGIFNGKQFTNDSVILFSANQTKQ